MVCRVHRWKLLIILSLITFFPLQSHAQLHTESSVRFHHLTPDESFGLANVWAILEDHEGFMWFGTEDGLIKYDGYEVTSYQQKRNDSSSIKGNILVCLYEDNQYNLWIGSYGGGLNLYKHDENRFYHFIHDPDDPHSLPYNAVKTIVQDVHGKLWFGTEGGGIAVVDIKEVDKSLPDLKFDILKHDPANRESISADHIRSMYCDKKGNIYVGTDGGGVDIIDPVTKKVITHLVHDPTDPNSLSGNMVYEVFVDSQERVWMGTQGDGLTLYLPDENRFVRYKATKETHTLQHNEIETITEDHDGNIWVGSDNGLSKFTDANKRIPDNHFENFQHEPQDPNSLLSNSIKIVYVDSKNSLWAGSYYGGINVYQKDYFKFFPIRNRPWKKNSLIGNNVTSFAEDKNGNLWVGTDGGGLNFLKASYRAQQEEHFDIIPLINPYTGEEQRKIKCLELDDAGYLWVGTWSSGMFRVNLQTRAVTYYGEDDDDPSFDAYAVLCIKKDTEDNLWIGSYNNGLTFYDRKRNSFTTYVAQYDQPDKMATERITSILVDSKDRVWIGGEIGGLNQFNKADGTFRKIIDNYRLNENLSILTLTEAHDGKIWIGTISGILIYDPEKETVEPINYQGIPDNVIHSMLQDETGKVWIGSNRGLLTLDTNGAVTNFTEHDGLQGNQFNHNSAYLCADGSMLFGGTKGYNNFRPDEIQRSDQHYPIVITKLWVNGELMEANKPGSVLTDHISEIETLELSHKQNSFTIEFASLEYNFSDRTTYMYQLQGFMDKWQLIGTDRKAIFTNLFPGEYTLRVKATNKDGFWSERTIPLTIKIHPAWWQTTWFKFALAISMVVLAFTIHQLRIRYLLIQQTRLEKEVNERTQALSESNRMLKAKIDEINSINKLLSDQQRELAEKNNEILSQNEELTSQNEQIITQQESLIQAQQRLKEINENLENLVNERTVTLQTTVKELNKTVYELDRFIYSASHDLSAPLKSIRGLVGLARTERDANALHQYIQYIDDSILKLEGVIENLIEYAKNAHLEIKYDNINLHQLISEVWNELIFLPETKKIKCIMHFQEDYIFPCDKTRLRTIVRNLISNSIKYADLMKEQPTIEVTASENGSYRQLVISDNGIGIDTVYVDKIFEMFFRATDKSKGSGLGLYIVKENISRLGGTIQTQSAKGKGTTFTINIPKKPAKD